jgi:hypothetical protein
MKQRIFVQPCLRRSVPDKVKELATYHLYLHKNFRLHRAAWPKSQWSRQEFVNKKYAHFSNDRPNIRQTKMDEKLRTHYCKNMKLKESYLAWNYYRIKIDNSASNCAWLVTGTPSVNKQQKQAWYHQQSLFCSPSRIMVLGTWLYEHCAISWENLENIAF